MTVEVVGVDWSLTGTGVCGAMGALTTLVPPTKAPVDRLVWLFRQAKSLVEDLDLLGSVLVFESPFMGMKGRADSSMQLGEMYGVVKVALRHWQGRVAWVAPSTLKTYATGKGNATKPDMRAELLKRTDLKLDIRDDNQCDAWWLRAMGLDWYGSPPLDLPQSHRRALNSVQWPGWR